MREMQPKMGKSGRAVVNVTQLFDRLCSNDSDTEGAFRRCSVGYDSLLERLESARITKERGRLVKVWQWAGALRSPKIEPPLSW